MSFQDGLAFCALIHRHRPDLIDYASLTSEDKLGNLNLAFDVAKEHLDVARLLDAEDIVNVPRPDERSIMTYVAQLYQVFSSLDKVETAGRRIGKFIDFARTIQELTNDYEKRARALKQAFVNKTEELNSAPLGDNYQATRDLIAQFRQYRKTQKREWVGEQEELAALLSAIQAKLKTNRRPPYTPPQGLTTADIEDDLNNLTQTESKRNSKLNAHLRSLLDQLRANFADKANAFHDQLTQIKAILLQDRELEQQLQAFQEGSNRLEQLSSQLPEIERAEKACDAANIEENEKTDHTYDDLWFAHNLLSKTFKKSIDLINNQIEASKSADISPEQVEEFKETFRHFDQDHDDKLSRLEFKSCLSGLGVVDLDFEGGDKRFEGIFSKVATGGENVDFQQFLKYMISITQDEGSPEQLEDSLNILAAGKDFITVNDMKVGQMTPEQISYITSVLPKSSVSADGYDYKSFVSNPFGAR